VDVIGIHGYYSMEDEKTAGTNWANIFLPGNTLTSRARGKKLLMVEEMSYVHTKLGHSYKKQAIWDQGNALNYRGIPWVRFLTPPLFNCSANCENSSTPT
jgi:hypothetical protein